MFEKIIQDSNRIAKRIGTLPKFVDYLHEELTPQVFKEKTEEVYEVNRKIVDQILKNL